MDKRSLLFVFAVTTSFFAIQWFGKKEEPNVAKIESLPPKKEKEWVMQQDPIVEKLDETFYVMENDYQQLVFSTKGGALAEINLPFQSKNALSIVREIDIDRKILKDSPQNSQFPLFPSISTASQEIIQPTEGGYYPLLRRSILTKEGNIQHKAPSYAYALNLSSLEGDLSSVQWKMSRMDANSIEFQTSWKGRTISKRFSFPQNQEKAPYCLDLSIAIDGNPDGLWLSSGIPDVELVGGSYAPLLRYQFTKASGNQVEDISLPKKTATQSEKKVNWLSNCNGFLGLIIDGISTPIEGFSALFYPGNEIPTRLSLIDAAYTPYPPANYPGYSLLASLSGKNQHQMRIFAGPYDDALLKKIDAIYRDPAQNYYPDYQEAQSIQGWFSFISEPFSKFLFFLMQIFFMVTRSWAASIILLTIALRLMMYPLNAWSIRSTSKMQEIAPKIKAVQEKYKKDPKRAQMEVIQLYKEAKVNPLTGCLPVLLQMPFLIGMFYLLKSSFPLRGAPFIPGWIDDLAAPDVLFSWGQPIWLIGNEFHLLPILMGVAMYLQQRFTSKLPKDPSKLSDSEKQQKMMGNMMAVLFTVMFYNFPSGLNLYFMFSTLLGVLQQWWMTNKKTKVSLS